MVSDKVAFEETVKNTGCGLLDTAQINESHLRLLHSANHSIVNLSPQVIDGRWYIASPRITHSERASPVENVPTIVKRLLSFSW